MIVADLKRSAMKTFRPNRLILGAVVAFLFLFAAGSCIALFREDDAIGKMTVGFLAALAVTLALVVWLSRRVRMEITDEYVAQVGWNPWRLKWPEVDKIQVREADDGRTLELLDRSGRTFTPFVFLFLSRRDEESLISALQEYKDKRPNQALQHNDPSCHVSCLRTPRASRGRG
jgi:hypothetical protein